VLGAAGELEAPAEAELEEGLRGIAHRSSRRARRRRASSRLEALDAVVDRAHVLERVAAGSARGGLLALELGAALL
jgi:hypothetical protein